MLATNSLVPTQAASSSSGSTSTPKRRPIQSAAARRNSGEPGDVGYPRSVPEEAMAASTSSGGGSNGVPIEQSTSPPEPANRSVARALAPFSRS